MERGNQLYKSYRQERIVEKTARLFDRIPQAKIEKTKDPIQVLPDKKKECMNLLRYVDIARARRYDIKYLLSFEITITSFFLTKENYLRPAENKSDLLKEIRPKQFPLAEQKISSRSATFIEFMAYVRKLDSRIKSESINTFGDFMQSLWNSFKRYSKGSERLDIIFDNYFENSAKAGERSRRSQSSVGVKTVITNFNQPLPPKSELSKFWACTENKIHLQQFFIEWVEENYDLDIPVYLGGCHDENKWNECYRVTSNGKDEIRLLYCLHEEADDRIQFHISQAVMVDAIEAALVCSGDTDVYTCLMYNYEFQWKENGLQELWQQHNEEVAPVHEAASMLERELVRILPAVHALTGCDMKSKISTKKRGFKTAKSEMFRDRFGEDQMSGDLMRAAEYFLVRCLATSESAEVSSFDALRHSVFHNRKKKIDLDTFPCSSACIRFHIKRSFLQTYKWKHSAKFECISLIPQDFAYRLEPGGLVPIIVPENKLPEDFPHPCGCLKCARATSCVCRINEILCCDFCKCRRECNYTTSQL